MAAYVPIDVYQGEDWSSEIVWTDQQDDPLPVVHPCRMDIKFKSGQTLYTLESNPDTPDGDIASINLSTELGLLQLYIPSTATAAFPPGNYNYDLFVSVDDPFNGSQTTPLIYGEVLVNKRVTVLAEDNTSSSGS